MATNKRLKVLHITKWFPNEVDPQNGIFIQRHIEAVADSVDNYILFVYESPLQEETVKAYRSTQPFGTLFRVPFRTGIRSMHKWFTKLAVFQYYIYNVVQPDLIHFHIATPDQALAAMLAHHRNIPFVVSEHWGGYLDKRFASFTFLQRRMVKYLMKKAHCVLPVSQVLLNGMRANALQFQAEVVPNVVRVPMAASKKFPDFTFVMIADMDDAIKRIREVITAFHHVVEMYPNVSLEIIGGGPDYDKVQDHVDTMDLQACVKLHGRKPQEEAMEILAASHCLLINSVRETFSVVGVEALSLGVPVISSPCGGPESYLDEAYSILTGAEMDLPTAMKHMYNNYETYQKGVQKFHALPFQMDVIGERLAQVYMAALQQYQ